MGTHRDGAETQARTTRFDYRPPAIRLGAGSVAALVDELDRQDCERALVVCGTTVGETRAVIEPVRDGIGDRLAGVFAETTPDKRLSTATDAAAELRASEADAFVGLGGGSSIDVATVASVLAADDRTEAAVASELAETGTITVPDGDLPPVVAVPTTLAGADMSQVAGITAGPESGLEEVVGGGVSDPRLMPAATVGDPELVATTPQSVLAASAMNGFDKGIETIYAKNATPVTDATAVRGLQLLDHGLRRLGREGPDAVVLEPVVEGLALVQYGISRPEGTTLSIIHAFGHGLTRTDDVQQGAAHAAVAPHVLAYLFEHVDARRELLASAFGVGGNDDPAAAIVESVAGVRDALDLPTRLRDVDGPGPDEFPAVAEAILADSFVANAPAGLDPTRADIEGVLEDAY